MKRVATFLAGALGVVAVAMLLPTNVFAVCPPTANQTIDLCSGGGEVIFSSTDTGPLSGVFWVQGLGNSAVDAGVDSGKWTGAPGVNGVSGADTNWLFEVLPESRCLGWDWGSGGTDGCPDGSTRLWVSVSDGGNRGFLASAAGNGTPSPAWIYDLSAVDNGQPAPNFGGSANGLALGRAVNVTSSSTSGGIVTVNVDALGIPNYGAGGGANLPGEVQLRGSNGETAPGAGAHSIDVPQDSDLCWQIVDGALTVPLGCVHIGGLTPSQNVLNAKTSFGRGELKFSWEVSAQFDVLGFNVIQKNVSKNTETKVNSALIPINGANDAQAASYNFSAGRKDLKATRGGFEIEMVRLNGETSRTPAPLR